MVTFVLQWLSALPLAAVALFAWRAGGERAGSRYHLTAWRVIGGAFIVFAICLFVQLASGTAAMVGGEGSWPYAAYLDWKAVLEHGRTFLVVGAAAALMALALRRQEPGRGFGRMATALMAAGMVAGAIGGVVEGRHVAGAHYTTVTLADVVELLILMGTLFVLLLTNRVDRYLWSLLAVYASSVALGIFWFVVVAQADVSMSWEPPNWTLSGVRMVLYGIMAYIAWRRWRAGRRGRPIRGMLGQERIQLSPAG